MNLQETVKRIEALEEDKAAISDEIKDVYKEAASSGFDKKTLQAVIARRKIERTEREQRDALLATYEGELA
jgi:uncharacterized protein (UPF0335 family)